MALLTKVQAPRIDLFHRGIKPTVSSAVDDDDDDDDDGCD
jgi:hypothetical protein